MIWLTFHHHLRRWSLFDFRWWLSHVQDVLGLNQLIVATDRFWIEQQYSLYYHHQWYKLHPMFELMNNDEFLWNSFKIGNSWVTRKQNSVCDSKWFLGSSKEFESLLNTRGIIFGREEYIIYFIWFTVYEENYHVQAYDAYDILDFMILIHFQWLRFNLFDGPISVYFKLFEWTKIAISQRLNVDQNRKI